MKSPLPKFLSPSAVKAMISLLLAIACVFEVIIAGGLTSDSYSYFFAILSAFFFVGFILMTIRLLWAVPPGETASPLRGMALILASLAFWSLAVGLVILIIGSATAFVAPGAGPLLIYGLAFSVTILMAVSAAGAVLRRRRTLLILATLEKSVQLNLPMPRMILAAAQSERGVLHDRLITLHDFIDRGTPLDQALSAAVPEIPPDILRAIAAGQRMGCLPHILSGIIRRRSGPYDPFTQTLGIYRVYPIIFLAVLWAVFEFVFPKFQGIFHDFKINLPQPAKFLFDLSNQSAFWWVILSLAALAPLGRGLQKIFPSFRNITPFNDSIGDQIIWWLPVAGGYARDRGMADLCDLASVGVEMGHPLDQTIRDAGSAQPSTIMRTRASAWADALARGTPIHQAARQARFPDLFVSMLATVRDSEGLLQVLGFLWRHYEYRFVRTRAILQAAYIPIIVFVMGAAVAILGISLLKPMAMLSEHIAGSISGGH